MSKKSYKEFIDSKKEEILLKKGEKIKGGKADGKPDSKYDKKQVKQGVKVEREHTTDKGKAKEITKDHLEEIGDYYTRLDKMEKQAKKEQKAKKFAKDFKKSYDFRDTKVSIDARDQAAAETTACPKLVKYLRTSLQDEINKIPLEKGILTLSKKEEGLYSGFFEDRHGQIIEKFDDVTVEIVAKTLEIKNLFVRPAEPREEENVTEDIDALTQEIAEITAEEYKQPTTIRIKYGELEFEIRKSINTFVNDFRKRQYTKSDIKKSIQAWSRNYGKVHNFANDIEAAEELSKNWEENRESFFQVLHNLQQLKKSE